MNTVIAAIDDLFFASKVNGAAQQADIRLLYAKTPDDILAKARSENPVLLIFDLNSTRTQPISTIEAIKQDEALKNIPILGYLSHIQIDLQQQATAAGCDRVMARSAFSQNLTAILLEAKKEVS